jgi:hypothetical protein
MTKPLFLFLTLGLVLGALFVAYASWSDWLTWDAEGKVTVSIVVGNFVLLAVVIWAVLDCVMAQAGVARDREGKLISNR